MGMRKLAYPINKNERGFFQVIYYTMEPSAIAEVERRFRINEELLRFVTIKYDSKREVEAWNHLVEKTKKTVAPEAAETAEAPEAAEAAPAPEAAVKTEETPAAE